MKLVIDSSAAFKWQVAEADSDKALRLRDDFQNGIHELLAPDIFAAELGHALTRAERQGRVTKGQALSLWLDIMATGVPMHPSYSLFPRAISISSDVGVGVYDCLYAALAEREGCDFVTADDR